MYYHCTKRRDCTLAEINITSNTSYPLYLFSCFFIILQEIEAEMARTQKNKATNYHLGTLKAKLAKLRNELLIESSGGGGGGRK